jgi:hypothetical protein
MIPVKINSFSYDFERKDLMKIPYFEALLSRWNSGEELEEIMDPSVSPDSLYHLVEYMKNPAEYRQDKRLLNKVKANADFFGIDIEDEPYVLIEIHHGNVRRSESFDRDEILKKFLVFVSIDQSTYYVSNDHDKMLSDETLDPQLVNSLSQVVSKVGLENLLTWYSYMLMQSQLTNRSDESYIFESSLLNTPISIIYKRIYSEGSVESFRVEELAVLGDEYEVILLKPPQNKIMFQHFSDINERYTDKIEEETYKINIETYVVRSINEEESDDDDDDEDRSRPRTPGVIPYGESDEESDGENDEET